MPVSVNAATGADMQGTVTVPQWVLLPHVVYTVAHTVNVPTLA